MPDNSYIQYGCFGLITFLIGWFVLYGFPKMMDTVTKAVDKTFAKIEALENRCNEERAKMMQDFRLELAAQREYYRIESEADRAARHKSVNDFTEIIAKIVMKT